MLGRCFRTRRLKARTVGSSLIPRQFHARRLIATLEVPKISEILFSKLGFVSAERLRRVLGLGGGWALVAERFRVGFLLGPVSAVLSWASVWAVRRIEAGVLVADSIAVMAWIWAGLGLKLGFGLEMFIDQARVEAIGRQMIIQSTSASSIRHLPIPAPWCKPTPTLTTDTNPTSRRVRVLTPPCVGWDFALRPFRLKVS
ncbi:hypothetical protein CRG98_032736 [Punica granatum]|uniref:Uncharacterized protein n=1 Tax=Punica granatum TaxID=22663 RepID=A0A2I0ISE7_PUNGR|nr:hypothetical protein CRG98_032736 [Punica granatum]